MMVADGRTYRDILQDLSRRQPPLTVRQHLRSLLDREPPDEWIASELRHSLVNAGQRIPEGLDRRWRPDIGETYVLLVGATRGHVGRLRVEAMPRTRPEPIHADGVDERAADQLRVAYHVLACGLAASGRGVPSSVQVRLWTTEGGPVEGASLGLSTAVALVSRWSQRAPAPDVAATAMVQLDGKLARVENLSCKLAALKCAYPEVRKVVVAADQETSAADCPPGVELSKRATVLQALADFDLDLASVEPRRLPVDACRREVEGLRFEHAPIYSRAEWEQRAFHAATLAAHEGMPAEHRAKAAMFAALFHLHAGELARAAHVLDDIPPSAIEELGAHAQAWHAVIRATAAIDRGEFDLARSLGEDGLLRARSLHGADQRDILGRALGTLGRALVHAGDARGAWPLLEESVKHHRTHEKTTLPRSLTYLATAYRRGGDLDRALETIEEAIALGTEQGDESESSASVLFGRYERGRVLYEREVLDRAREDHLFVRHAQPQRWDYPRLGTLRYLTAIAIRQNDPLGPELLREAVETANALVMRPALHAVAAAACGEALRWPSSISIDLRRRAATVWTAFRGDIDDATALGRVVY